MAENDTKKGNRRIILNVLNRIFVLEMASSRLWNLPAGGTEAKLIGNVRKLNGFTIWSIPTGWSLNRMPTHARFLLRNSVCRIECIAVCTVTIVWFLAKCIRKRMWEIGANHSEEVQHIEIRVRSLQIHRSDETVKSLPVSGIGSNLAISLLNPFLSCVFEKIPHKLLWEYRNSKFDTNRCGTYTSKVWNFSKCIVWILGTNQSQWHHKCVLRTPKINEIKCKWLGDLRHNLLAFQ